MPACTRASGCSAPGAPIGGTLSPKRSPQRHPPRKFRREANRRVHRRSTLATKIGLSTQPLPLKPRPLTPVLGTKLTPALDLHSEIRPSTDLAGRMHTHHNPRHDASGGPEPPNVEDDIPNFLLSATVMGDQWQRSPALLRITISLPQGLSFHPVRPSSCVVFFGPDLGRTPRAVHGMVMWWRCIMCHHLVLDEISGIPKSLGVRTHLFLNLPLDRLLVASCLSISAVLDASLERLARKEHLAIHCFPCRLIHHLKVQTVVVASCWKAVICPASS